MKKNILKVIGAIQAIGGLAGLVVYIIGQSFEPIPIMFLTVSLIAGIFLIIKERIGIIFSVIVLIPQLLQVEGDTSNVFSFHVPFSAGISFTAPSTIGVYSGVSLTPSFAKEWPVSLNINLLAFAAVLYMLKKYEQNQSIEPTFKTSDD